MPNKKKFYRTVFELEVLSDEPIGPDIEVEDLLYECNEGGYSGDFKITNTEEVSSEKMRELLVTHGSDPDFFNWGDEPYGCDNCGNGFTATEALHDAEGGIHCPKCASAEVGVLDYPFDTKEGS